MLDRCANRDLYLIDESNDIFFRSKIKLVFHNYFPSIRKLFSTNFQNQTHLSILKLWDQKCVLLLQKAENYFPTLSLRVPGSSLSYNKPQPKKVFPPSRLILSVWDFPAFPRLFSRIFVRNAPRFNVLSGSWTSHNLERKIAKLLSHFCATRNVIKFN